MMIRDVPYHNIASKELVVKRTAWARHYMNKGAARHRAEILARKKTERSPMPPVNLEIERPNRRQRSDGTYMT